MWKCSLQAHSFKYLVPTVLSQVVLRGFSNFRSWGQSVDTGYMGSQPLRAIEPSTSAQPRWHLTQQGVSQALLHWCGCLRARLCETGSPDQCFFPRVDSVAYFVTVVRKVIALLCFCRNEKDPERKEHISESASVRAWSATQFCLSCFVLSWRFIYYGWCSTCIYALMLEVGSRSYCRWL